MGEQHKTLGLPGGRDRLQWMEAPTHKVIYSFAKVCQEAERIHELLFFMTNLHKHSLASHTGKG